MVRNRLFFVIILLFINASSLTGQTKWSFELCGGAPYNFPSYIKIHQAGYNDMAVHNARFYSEPFTLPPYWDWRLARIKNNSIIELEAIHHKLYLKNKPSEIKRFSISHGFNMFFINYGKIKKRNFIIRAGLGTVFSHPETDIRGHAFEDKGEFLNTDYYLSGPAVNLSAGKKWHVIKRLFINTEIKTTIAYAKVPVALGYAKVFTSSLQFVAGLGFDFISKE